jgi:hypothetical protein
MTASSGPLATGTDSPVIIDSSRCDLPCTTSPSAATLAPGSTYDWGRGARQTSRYTQKDRQVGEQTDGRMGGRPDG